MCMYLSQSICIEVNWSGIKLNSILFHSYTYKLRWIHMHQTKPKFEHVLSVLSSLLLVRPAITTGNACFAEGLKICRGPNLGHSAKTLFAEGQTQEPSEKNGPRQRGPDPRQRQAPGKSNLCRGPRAEALGKDVLGKLGPLGHGGHFLSIFAEGHPLGPRQRFFFPVQPDYSAIFF